MANKKVMRNLLCLIGIHSWTFKEYEYPDPNNSEVINGTVMTAICKDCGLKKIISHLDWPEIKQELIDKENKKTPTERYEEILRCIEIEPLFKISEEELQDLKNKSEIYNKNEL